MVRKRRILCTTTRKVGAFGSKGKKNKSISLFIPIPKEAKILFKKGNLVRVDVYSDGIEIHRL